MTLAPHFNPCLLALFADDNYVSISLKCPRISAETLPNSHLKLHQNSSDTIRS